MKKKIYLSAPLSAGNLKNHIGRFLRYAGYTMKEGVIPVAVHFYVFGETDDLQADSAAKISFEERFSLIWFCDEMWVFGPVITQDMEREIEFCEKPRCEDPIYYRKEVTKKLGEKKS